MVVLAVRLHRHAYSIGSRRVVIMRFWLFLPISFHKLSECGMGIMGGISLAVVRKGKERRKMKKNSKTCKLTDLSQTTSRPKTAGL